MKHLSSIAAVTILVVALIQHRQTVGLKLEYVALQQKHVQLYAEHFDLYTNYIKQLSRDVSDRQKTIGQTWEYFALLSDHWAITNELRLSTNTGKFIYDGVTYIRSK